MMSSKNMPTLALAQPAAPSLHDSPDGKWLDWSRITPRQWNAMWRSFEGCPVIQEQDHFFFERSNAEDPYLPANKYKTILYIGADPYDATAPWYLTVSFMKLNKKSHYIDVPVCDQKLSLDRIPTRAALSGLDWQFRGNHQVRVSAQNREWFLEQYAGIID
jgi:hypothetical protein